MDNDEQVYIAVFDVPVDSNIIGANMQTYALVFGLNTPIYLGTDDVLTGLKKGKCNESHAIIINKFPSGLGKMQLAHNVEFYESKNIRAYLKTGKGIFSKN